MCKTYLITGGTGFLGSRIIKDLQNEHSTLVILKRSFSNTFRLNEIISSKIVYYYNVDKINIESIFFKHNIDCVIHCATNYGKNLSNPMDIIEANFILPLKLIQLCNKNKVRFFINTDTILNQRINFYSLSKLQFKQWFEMYAQDLCCINVELEHFYGPFDDKSKFVPYILQSLINNVDKIDLTKGEQLRYFIYIDDVIKAFRKIFNSFEKLDNGYYRYQIASDTSLSIREFVELVKKITNNTTTRLNFGALPYRDNEIMNPLIDTTTIKNLGWKAEWSIEDGIKRTLIEERMQIKV